MKANQFGWLSISPPFREEVQLEVAKKLFPNRKYPLPPSCGGKSRNSIKEMIEQYSVTDDFTFPTVADNSSPPYFGFPGFTASSVWSVPSTFSDCSHEQSNKPSEEESDFDVVEETHKQKRLPLGEDGNGTDTSEKVIEFSDDGHPNDAEVSSFDVDGEEKMDMLWEDFNDELGRRTSLRRKEAEKGNGSLKDLAICMEPGANSSQVGRVKVMKVSKSATMLPHRRPSLLVILKVLKKLFLFHNSHHPKRT